MGKRKSLEDTCTRIRKSRRKKNDSTTPAAESSPSTAAEGAKSTTESASKSPSKERRSSKDEPSGSQESETQNPRPDSPEPSCSICLGQVENKSFTDSCFHTFCFVCLLEWSKVKAVCPLCKQAFKSIIHNVRSIEDYDQYELPQEPPPEERFRYRTTLTGSRWEDRRRREEEVELNRLRRPTRSSAQIHWQRTRQASSTAFRRRVYNLGMHVQEITTAAGRPVRYREISPAWFRRYPACTHRLVPWLNRELVVLLSHNEQQVQFLLELILDLIKRFDIQSEEFKQHVIPFLGRQTDHFIHEFYMFARSPTDIVNFDRNAIYHEPTENQAIYTLPSSSSSSDDEENNEDDDDVIIVSSADGAVASNPRQTGRDHTYIRSPSRSDSHVTSPRNPLSLSPLLNRVRGFFENRDTAQSGWDSPTPGPSNFWSASSFFSPLTTALSSIPTFQDLSTIYVPPLLPQLRAMEDDGGSIASSHESDIEVVGEEKPWTDRSPITLLSSDEENSYPSEAKTSSRSRLLMAKKHRKEQKEKNATEERSKSKTKHKKKKKEKHHKKKKHSRSRERDDEGHYSRDRDSNSLSSRVRRAPASDREDQAKCSKDRDERHSKYRHTRSKYSRDEDSVSIHSVDRDSRATTSRERYLRLTVSRERDVRRANSRDEDVRSTQSRDRDSRSTQSRDRDSRAAYSRDRDLRATYSRDRDSRATHSRDRDSRATYSRDRDSRATYSQDRDSKATYSRDRDSRATHSRDRDSRATHSRDRDSRATHSRDRDSRASYSRDREIKSYYRDKDNSSSRSSERCRDSRLKHESGKDKERDPQYSNRTICSEEQTNSMSSHSKVSDYSERSFKCRSESPADYDSTITQESSLKDNVQTVDIKQALDTSTNLCRIESITAEYTEHGLLAKSENTISPKHDKDSEKLRHTNEGSPSSSTQKKPHKKHKVKSKHKKKRQREHHKHKSKDKEPKFVQLVNKISSKKNKVNVESDCSDVAVCEDISEQDESTSISLRRRSRSSSVEIIFKKRPKRKRRRDTSAKGDAKEVVCLLSSDDENNSGSSSDSRKDDKGAQGDSAEKSTAQPQWKKNSTGHKKSSSKQSCENDPKPGTSYMHDSHSPTVGNDVLSPTKSVSSYCSVPSDTTISSYHSDFSDINVRIGQPMQTTALDLSMSHPDDSQVVCLENDMHSHSSDSTMQESNEKIISQDSDDQVSPIHCDKTNGSEELCDSSEDNDLIIDEESDSKASSELGNMKSIDEDCESQEKSSDCDEKSTDVNLKSVPLHKKFMPCLDKDFENGTSEVSKQLPLLNGYHDMSRNGESTAMFERDDPMHHESILDVVKEALAQVKGACCEREDVTHKNDVTGLPDENNDRTLEGIDTDSDVDYDIDVENEDENGKENLSSKDLVQEQWNARDNNESKEETRQLYKNYKTIATKFTNNEMDSAILNVNDDSIDNVIKTEILDVVNCGSRDEEDETGCLDVVNGSTREKEKQTKLLCAVDDSSREIEIEKDILNVVDDNSRGDSAEELLHVVNDSSCMGNEKQEGGLHTESLVESQENMNEACEDCSTDDTGDGCLKVENAEESMEKRTEIGEKCLDDEAVDWRIEEGSLDKTRTVHEYQEGCDNENMVMNGERGKHELSCVKEELNVSGGKSDVKYTSIDEYRCNEMCHNPGTSKYCANEPVNMIDKTFSQASKPEDADNSMNIESKSAQDSCVADCKSNDCKSKIKLISEKKDSSSNEPIEREEDDCKKQESTREDCLDKDKNGCDITRTKTEPSDCVEGVSSAKQFSPCIHEVHSTSNYMVKVCKNEGLEVDISKPSNEVVDVFKTDYDTGMCKNIVEGQNDSNVCIDDVK